MKEFNAKETKNKIIEFIRDYYKKNNLKGAVMGISGGKDSGVAAGLFAEALGAENLIGVTLPCHSKEQDRKDAQLVADKFGFKLINFDLTDIYDEFQKNNHVVGDYTEEDLIDADINLKPRLRTATLYRLAAMYSKINNGTYLVAGTDNKCEVYVGYFTKNGDGPLNVDISVLSDLTVDQVIAVGEEIGVPEEVLYKAPSDGLSGQIDEDRLGVTYKEIADYMEDPNTVEEKARQKIKHLHEANQHKFNCATFINN